VAVHAISSALRVHVEDRHRNHGIGTPFDCRPGLGWVNPSVLVNTRRAASHRPASTLRCCGTRSTHSRSISRVSGPLAGRQPSRRTRIEHGVHVDVAGGDSEGRMVPIPTPVAGEGWRRRSARTVTSGWVATADLSSVAPACRTRVRPRRVEKHHDHGGPSNSRRASGVVHRGALHLVQDVPVNVRRQRDLAVAEGRHHCAGEAPEASRKVAPACRRSCSRSQDGSAARERGAMSGRPATLPNWPLVMSRRRASG
jgi:hypothetical protein